MNSGDLSPGNHVLGGAGNLVCPRQIQRARNLEATAHFEHCDDVTDGNAFKQPQTRRSDVDRALGIVERIGFVRTTFGQRTSQLYSIFFSGEFTRYPGPVVFRIRLLTRKNVRGFTGANRNRVDQRIIEPKVFGFRDGIAWIFSGDEMSRIVFVIQESREPENPIAVGASGISAKGDCQ